MIRRCKCGTVLANEFYKTCRECYTSRVMREVDRARHSREKGLELAWVGREMSARAFERELKRRR